jgi:hypothetical protein
MRTLILVAVVLLAACGQTATQTPTGGIEVANSWAAPSPDGVDVAAGYLVIRNDTDADDQLIAVSSPRAASVEVHEMITEDAVMRMRALPALSISAHSEAILEPGGTHLMFMGVSEPFSEGEDIPLTLTFANAGAIEVAMPVRRPGLANSENGHDITNASH